MKKISDFFAIEAFYDDSKSKNLIYFYWDEGNEKYVWDFDNKTLLEGDEDSFTWKTVITDWYEANRSEIDSMILSNDIHYVKDVLR